MLLLQNIKYVEEETVTDFNWRKLCMEYFKEKVYYKKEMQFHAALRFQGSTPFESTFLWNWEF